MFESTGGLPNRVFVRTGFQASGRRKPADGGAGAGRRAKGFCDVKRRFH
jgi:hypothetical protein